MQDTPPTHQINEANEQFRRFVVRDMVSDLATPTTQSAAVVANTAAWAKEADDKVQSLTTQIKDTHSKTFENFDVCLAILFFPFSCCFLCQIDEHKEGAFPPSL